MDKNDLRNKLFNSDEYKSLRDRPEFCNIQYLTLGGSISYGTNIETSDIDLRGYYFLSKSEFLGFDMKDKEIIDTDVDTVVYSLHKFIKLLANCNPNMIELIGTKPEHRIIETKYASMIIDNYELFLSKRAFSTFAGYATQQLRRLENALARDEYPAEEKEKHILKSLEANILASKDAFKLLSDKNKIDLYIEESKKEDMKSEIYIDLDIKHVALRDFISLRNQLGNTLTNFSKIRHRNKKKDKNHLYKHAMHLIRLYYMAFDILENCSIITYREKEHDLLMSIRNGEMPLDKIFELREKLEAKLQKVYDESKLPEKPDMKRVNQLVIDILTDYY